MVTLATVLELLGLVAVANGSLLGWIIYEQRQARAILDELRINVAVNQKETAMRDFRLDRLEGHLRIR